jgi:NAD(P)-dependent dehydrogenase (short-subunit alcohol dehydrogenase family)
LREKPNVLVFAAALSEGGDRNTAESSLRGAAMFRKDLLKGKKILVTGGGTGLGRSMADKYAELGAELVLCGRRKEMLDQAAEDMNKKWGAKVSAIPCDIRVAQAIEDMVAEVWRSGPLDGLVNNAAGNFISQTKDLSPRAFDAIANIVFHGTFYMTNAVGKRWIEDKRKGSVLSILTTWVWTGSPFVVPSAMSKAGVAAMTKSLAVEWGHYGIRLNAIAPGPFPTEGAWARLSPKGDNVDYKERIPLGRVGNHSELANMAAFMMADEVEYLSGEVIALDGAQWLQGTGTFSSMLKYSERDWQEIRDKIKTSNDADKAKRTV